MFPGAPRTLVVLLGLVVALRLILVLIAPGPIVFSLLQVGLIGFFSWQALHGKEGAAKVLSILLLIGAALDIFAVVGALAAGLLFGAIFLAVPAFHIGVAIYVFRSQAVKAFFAKAAYAQSYAP